VVVVPVVVGGAGAVGGGSPLLFKRFFRLTEPLFGEKRLLQGLDCIVPIVDFLVAAFRDRIRCVLVNYVHVRAVSG
jgi:hypothetical protein